MGVARVPVGKGVVMDDFFIRLGKVIGNGTGIEVDKTDELYWRLGHFVTALMAVLAFIVVMCALVLWIAKNKERENGN